MSDAFINILKSASITDWLMVFVTTVYVILTSRIMHANKTSADIAKKQLEDSQKQLEEVKRQNEEARRLEFMPYLQLQKYKVPPEKTNKYVFELFSISDPTAERSYFRYILVNIGNGTATNIHFEWTSDLQIHEPYRSSTLDAIMNGSDYLITFSIISLPDTKKYLGGTLIFTYEDLIGHYYTQRIKLSYNSSGNVIITNEGPSLQ